MRCSRDDDWLSSRCGALITSGNFSAIYKSAAIAYAETWQGCRLSEYAVKVASRASWCAFARVRGATLHFENEADMLSNLRRPNIIELLAYEVTDSALYLQLPYMQQGDLLQRLKFVQPRCSEHIRLMGSEVLSAINYLHIQDIIHRDIKLDNILCTGRPSLTSLQLIGFQFSRFVGNGCATVCGTPMYMAPELLAADPTKQAHLYKHEVDAWSFGVVFFAMHYGELPFDMDETGNPQVLGAGVPAFESACIKLAARQILEGLLEHEPTKRLAITDVPLSDWLEICC